MNFENHTERVRGLVQASQTLALALGHQKLISKDVLKTVFEDREGLAPNLLGPVFRYPRAALRNGLPEPAMLFRSRRAEIVLSSGWRPVR